MGASGLTTDLAVIGGGPAGSAAAAAACAAGLGVTLFSAGAPRSMRAGEALPPGTEQVVEDIFGPLGLGTQDQLAAYGNRSAWGGEELETAEFMFNPFGPGRHLDRNAFDAALIAAVRARGVHVVDRARVTRALYRNGGWDLDVAGRTRARFLVDATGRGARFARAQGAVRRRLDRQVAIVWLLEASDDDPDSTTTIEAVENGWWYTHPVPGRRRIAAFLTDADLLPSPRDRPARGWWPAARPPAHVSAIVESCRTNGPPRIADAATTYLDRVTGPGWLAVGDAAVAFDPLASQGIVTALLMGYRAGRVAAGIETAEGFGDDYRLLHEEHLALRSAYYAIEHRWPRAPFWLRRESMRSSDHPQPKEAS
jgi:flavin-dependent dehydrogenase